MRAPLFICLPKETQCSVWAVDCSSRTKTMSPSPLTVAIVTSAMNSQRIGLASVLVFMVLGLGLMFFVREEQSTAHTEH